MYIGQCSNQVLNSKDEHQPHFPVHRRKKKYIYLPNGFPDDINCRRLKIVVLFSKINRNDS